MFWTWEMEHSEKNDVASWLHMKAGGAQTEFHESQLGSNACHSSRQPVWPLVYYVHLLAHLELQGGEFVRV